MNEPKDPLSLDFRNTNSGSAELPLTLILFIMGNSTSYDLTNSCAATTTQKNEVVRTSGQNCTVQDAVNVANGSYRKGAL